jgi:hypothetical protein
MTQLGWIGVWLLIISSVAILLEVLVMGVWSLRLSRSARTLSVQINDERAAIQADLERLRVALEETQMLWRPYARVLRWLNHPLVIALIGSYRRRWAAR